MSEPQPARDVAEHVSAVLSTIFAWLDELGGHFQAVYDQAARADQDLCSDSLCALRDPIFAQLHHARETLAGTGVILSENLLPDHPHLLEWWQNNADAPPSYLVVEHDPASVDFYDYQSAAWFAIPRESGGRALVGPYVDYSGTDEYMLTLARPVHSGSRFLGVAAADIHSGMFETLLLRIMGHAIPAVALVNSTGRVVASNTASRVTGSLVSGDMTNATYPITLSPSTLDITRPCSGLPWALMVLGPP